MNNYLIQFNGDYGIYQTDKDMREVKMLFSEHATIEQWPRLEQIQRHAEALELNYVGFDMFYR
jgi:hypothetical protein